MIHLASVTDTADPTQSFFNGLQQSFAPQPNFTTASVDVFVLSGPVILALYANNGGVLINSVYGGVANQWVTLSITAPTGTNPDLLILYSGSTTGIGEFYIDHAVVTSVPEPSSAFLGLIGISLGLLLAVAQRRLSFVTVHCRSKSAENAVKQAEGDDFSARDRLKLV